MSGTGVGPPAHARSRGDPRSRDATRLTTLAREQGATELVVGLPLNADGTEGSQALDTRAWADAVRVELRPRDRVAR